MKHRASAGVARAHMKQIFTVGCGLVALGLVALSATGWSQPSEAKPVVPLGNADVFTGPSAGKYEPPAGSVAQFHLMPDSATFWRTFGGLKAGVTAAKTLVVFQGRPRAVPKFGERVEVEPTEEEKKWLFMKDGEWIRVWAQEVPLEVADALRTAVFEGVRERKGVKLCGGFHADFLLRWEGPGLVAGGEALICFGCSEVKLYGATGSLHGDMAEGVAKRLRELLAPFAEKRNAAGAKDPAGTGGAKTLPTPPARL